MHNLLKLHALPTDKLSPLYLGITKEWIFDPEGDRRGCIPHHLYLTSGEEIKEGEWKLHPDSGVVDRARDTDFSLMPTNKLGIHGWRKIVATTNPDLWKEKVYGYRDNKWGEIPTGIWKIPESLIKAFVDSQRKLKEVLVEYDEGKMVYYELGCHKSSDTCKLTPSGEIIWKPVVERMWNDEQVYTFVQHLRTIDITNIAEKELFIKDEMQKWFNKNYSS